VIVQVAYGEDWGVSEKHPPRLWMTEIAELTALRQNNPMVKYSGFQTDRRIRHLESLLDKEFYRILDRRLADASAVTASKTKDICSIAIDQMKSADGSLSDDDKITIMHQLKTFYFAGNDTTATLISWAMWLLSQHDEAVEKLLAELKKQKIWADGKTPTYDQLQNCTYLEAVLQESLRLYPPASSARYTSDLSETWGNYTIGGSIFVYISTYVMHRRNRPDDLVPERFLDASKKPAFNAWSRGPRDCQGKYFAMLEAKMAAPSF
jgi:cytokinin trans-hydroxylase